MTYQTPCSKGDQDDWFILSDGRQYSDVDLVIIPLSEEGSRREWLRRRQSALAKCFNDCYLRLACLDHALETRPLHGTWGGYSEEQLRVLYTEIDNRRLRKQGE